MPTSDPEAVAREYLESELRQIQDSIAPSPATRARRERRAARRAARAARKAARQPAAPAPTPEDAPAPMDTPSAADQNPDPAPRVFLDTTDLTERAPEPTYGRKTVTLDPSHPLHVEAGADRDIYGADANARALRG